MTECSRALAQLRAQDEEAYGGKSASLGELIAGGIPVPPGFAISTAAFDAFLATQSLRERVEDVLAGLDADDVAAVARASAQVALLMRRTPVPDIVAAARELCRPTQGNKAATKPTPSLKPTSPGQATAGVTQAAPAAPKTAPSETAPVPKAAAGAAGKGAPAPAAKPAAGPAKGQRR